MNPDSPTVSKLTFCNKVCGLFSAKDSYVHNISLDFALGCGIPVELTEHFPNLGPIIKNCEERRVGIVD